uniref:Uncharacterized protein n=1 Tax=Cannabis sativa TaxID=3483 RepID=A0A803QXL8_CANSA
MQDPIGIPACFSSTEKLSDDPAAVTRSGQSVVMSIYRTKIANHSRLITVTWCKNLLLHGLSVSVESPDKETQYNCKVELKPWYFWRKNGSKRFVVDNKPVDIFWDLRNVKFNGETEPNSDYYVAVVCDQEVVLLLGDLRKEAYKKTGSRPSLIDPILVSRKEHVFGKKKFLTRAKFHEKGRLHEISIECRNRAVNNGNFPSGVEPEMEIKLDGHLLIHVKHLQWKFRGLRHALFIFKPIISSSTSLSSLSSSSSSSPPLSSLASTPLSSQTGSSGSLESLNPTGSSEFCLFLYAWKVE